MNRYVANQIRFIRSNAVARSHSVQFLYWIFFKMEKLSRYGEYLGGRKESALSRSREEIWKGFEWFFTVVFNRTCSNRLVGAFFYANKKQNEQNAPSKRRRLENSPESNADTVSNDDTTQIDNDEVISTNDTNEKVFKCYTVLFVSFSVRIFFFSLEICHFSVMLHLNIILKRIYVWIAS